MVENYLVLSLETHLFFSRIMKEHALFLEAGFPCKDSECISKAEHFRKQFEELLEDVVKISDGRVNRAILDSCELVTEFTLAAEERTECLSGAAINTKITEMEKNLTPISIRENRTDSNCENNCRNNHVNNRGNCGGDNRSNNRNNNRNNNIRNNNSGNNNNNNNNNRNNIRNNNNELIRAVNQINERAVCLLDELIEFKECILKEVSEGKLFTANYPLLIKHILREAKLYRTTINNLMSGRQVSYRMIWGTEEFWNQIMMEHALFIRGLLDPCEEDLIKTANCFAGDYKKLLETARKRDCAANGLTEESLEQTLKYREFKEAGTKGILNCDIESIILPLLTDHVLREANHYIRILEHSHGRDNV